MDTCKIYDIGKELFSTPAYPGDPVPQKRPHCEIEKGADCNLTVITMGSHNGTHLDAPKHFCAGKHGVDEIPLEKCVGICRVAEASGPLGREEMEKLLEGGVKRLLVKGDILMTPEAAQVCAEAELYLLGVENQTVGNQDTMKEVHRTLLGAEVVILEGLVLEKVKGGEYFLAAQPMNMAGLDGSPVRPLLLEF